MRAPLYFTLLILLFGASCKKDQLHWINAERIETGTTNKLNKILFVNDTLGYIVGGDRFLEADILITRDGGRTWQIVSFPDAGKELFDIAQAPSGTVYALGFEGRLLWSSNAFSTHSFKQLDYEPYKGLAFIRADRFIGIGGISFELGFIHTLDTAGEFYNRDRRQFELNSVKMLPNGIGYVSGYGVMLRTTDSAKSWSFQDLHSDNFKAIDVHGKDTVYTCGYGGSIFRTFDGGNGWDCLRNSNDISKPRYHLLDILMLDAQHGYCVGESGVVIYTDDGGDHWSEVDKFTSEDLNNIVSLPSGALMVCGNGGVLYRLYR